MSEYSKTLNQNLPVQGTTAALFDFLNGYYKKGIKKMDDLENFNLNISDSELMNGHYTDRCRVISIDLIENYVTVAMVYIIETPEGEYESVSNDKARFRLDELNGKYRFGSQGSRDEFLNKLERMLGGKRRRTRRSRKHRKRRGSRRTRFSY